MPLYSLALLLVLLLGAPFWLVRMLLTGRYRAGLLQRLGRTPPSLRSPNPRVDVWIHAVSVGEVLAAASLWQALLHDRPTWRVAVSTTTEAGQQLARQRFPGSPVFYLPLDFAHLLRRRLRQLRPHTLLLMESELWPNLLREAQRAGCRIVVANARISDRSFPRYRRLRRLWQPLLRRVDLFLAQGEETAARLRSLGVAPDRIRNTGNLKHDLRPPAQGRAWHIVSRLRARHRGLVVAGSTLEGEEDLLLQAWPLLQRTHPGSLLLLAPRHPSRFDRVAARIAAHGLPLLRLSHPPAAPQPSPAADPPVLLLDTIGDLASIYSLATVAFVGGSLVPAGGHNPLEPALFGVPIVVGPSSENFREIVQGMLQANAIRITPAAVGSPRAAERLASSLADLLSGTAAARALGSHALAFFRQHAGTADRMARQILALAPGPSTAAPAARSSSR